MLVEILVAHCRLVIIPDDAGEFPGAVRLLPEQIAGKNSNRKEPRLVSTTASSSAAL
jgi:hypothetical protein